MGMHGAGAAEDGGKIPNRPGGQGLHSLAQSGRYGIKFDRRLARDSLRPLVEPGVENQATDRAYRIGQKKNVMVHRMITKNTFEEKIDEMIQRKKHLADMTVATGESWIGKLSNKELREIFE